MAISEIERKHTSEITNNKKLNTQSNETFKGEGRGFSSALINTENGKGRAHAHWVE